MKTVPEMLEEAAATYRERNKIYGDNYLEFGKVMDAILPDMMQGAGDNADKWNRLGLLVQMVSKLTRYGQNMTKGGHDDSLLDLAVYATMLREVDGMIREKKFVGDEEAAEAVEEDAQADLFPKDDNPIWGDPYIVMCKPGERAQDALRRAMDELNELDALRVQRERGK